MFLHDADTNMFKSEFKKKPKKLGLVKHEERNKRKKKNKDLHAIYKPIC